MQAGDLKKGTRIEMDGDPYSVVSLSRRTPSARGASTLISAKLRNLRTKQLREKQWKAGDKLKEPDFEIRNSLFLYSEGEDLHHFMDEESYEQFSLPRDAIEAELDFMKPNDSVRAMMFEGQCIGIEIDHTVVLEITRCDPGIKGDTVNNVTKPATLETGVEIQVPLFVNEGDKVIVDTRESRYVKRA